MTETTIRPRRGDFEAATQPHPFRPSGEYAGPARAEVCDLCGLAQRGTAVHPDAGDGHIAWRLTTVIAPLDVETMLLTAIATNNAGYLHDVIGKLQIVSSVPLPSAP